MSESNYQLPSEGTSGKIVRFISLLIGGQPRLHEVNINATPDGTLYDARGGFSTMVVIDDTNVTTVAAAFSSQVCVTAMIVADLENSDWIQVGDVSAQPIQLGPGDKITLPVANTNMIYRKSRTGTQKAAVVAMSG